MAKYFPTEDMEQMLLDYGICSEEFLEGAICAGGYNQDTMERVLSYKTALRYFDQLLEELEEEED